MDKDFPGLFLHRSLIVEEPIVYVSYLTVEPPELVINPFCKYNYVGLKPALIFFRIRANQ
ncbi:MAG: hypothetical protein A2Z75_00805 [Chloroflexi bacterium RBG_13_50_10]|nr:MAG: hypothetical protein A2Z75_00805 [Chloroflexi bacterium RBG_13_50_10]